MEEKTRGVIEALHDLADDNTLPKNIRDKLQGVIIILDHEGELSLKIDRALHDLEEISEDNNLQAYARTQVWNIVSMLEMIK